MTLTEAQLSGIERDARENRPLVTGDILAMVDAIRALHKDRDNARSAYDAMASAARTLEQDVTQLQLELREALDDVGALQGQLELDARESEI